MKEYDYKNKLSVCRARRSTATRKASIDQFYSDRSRILYCSSFRRLQQKAQVFSLEPNSSVRTRLTHSLEVADLGRTLANRIAYGLNRQGNLSPTNIPVFVAIVENACLVHDIGNPPFGHFGEAAIKDWARKESKHILLGNPSANDELASMLMHDFTEFDGNPQGFRTISKLHTESDQFGLNLTYATLLCSLKYSRSAGEESGKGILKKAGYFITEQEFVEKLYREIGIPLHHRYPLTYIMEAADDIAYCMSDIADGIEKGILTEEMFVKEFLKEWESNYRDEELPVRIPDKEKMLGFKLDISVPWSKAALNAAEQSYFENHDKIYYGEAHALIEEHMPMGKVLETIKNVSNRVLYTSIEAESIELTGYAVITGILKHYKRMLELPFDKFYALINGEKVKDADVERRLFNRIGNRYVKAYKYAIEDLGEKDIDDKKNPEKAIKERWLRIHLLIDHISGMTDEYALETYQMLEGISLMRR